MTSTPNESATALPESLSIFESTPPADSPLTAELPLTKARRRLNGWKVNIGAEPSPRSNRPAELRSDGRRKGAGTPRKGIRFHKVTPKLEASVAALAANGVTNRKNAKVHGISPETVGKIVRKPENQEFIGGAREYMRAYALANLLDLQRGAWTMLSDAIANKDPRAFDQITRGLNALEKIGASTGGDTQKIETEHTIKSDLAVEEARELLKKLTA